MVSKWPPLVWIKSFKCVLKFSKMHCSFGENCYEGFEFLICPCTVIPLIEIWWVEQSPNSLNFRKWVLLHSLVVYTSWGYIESCWTSIPGFWSAAKLRKVPESPKYLYTTFFHWFYLTPWSTKTRDVLLLVQGDSVDQIWPFWRLWACSTVKSFEDLLPLLICGLMLELVAYLQQHMFVLILEQLDFLKFIHFESTFLFAHLPNCFTIRANLTGD